MSQEKIGHWTISKDKITVFEDRHFVAKCPFDNGGLSLMAKETSSGFQVELAIEQNESVVGCFRLDNTATRKEAAKQVASIIEAI